MALLGAKMKPTVGFGTMLALKGGGSLGFAAAVAVFETRLYGIIERTKGVRYIPSKRCLLNSLEYLWCLGVSLNPTFCFSLDIYLIVTQ